MDEELALRVANECADLRASRLRLATAWTRYVVLCRDPTLFKDFYDADAEARRIVEEEGG